MRPALQPSASNGTSNTHISITHEDQRRRSQREVLLCSCHLSRRGCLPMLLRCRVLFSSRLAILGVRREGSGYSLQEEDGPSLVLSVFVPSLCHEGNAKGSVVVLVRRCL